MATVLTNPSATRRLLGLLALLFAVPGFAHQQPNTLVILDIGQGQAEMTLHVPLPELELAFGHDVTQNPESNSAAWGLAFQRYLLDHIHPLTAAGQPWTVRVREMRIGRAEQTQSGPFQEVFAHLLLIPPAGASVRDFVLRYDVIMHQVVTHRALVSLHSDWGAGRIEPSQIGVIAVNTGTNRIDPLVIHLGEGNWWAGFARMVRLGMEHIREGTDHLLFLLVLLLPATLTVRRGRQWGEFGGSHYSLVRLARIVTAFTLGHSVTLLAGALQWLTLPQQPVEVLIAFSVLVTAIHAYRPIFPGREGQVAAGFGLVHGLAFATVLADLQLSGSRMALSILGFNLGIELMQLFIVALTVPWLILLSMTPAHRWVRQGGAVLAAIAATGWIVNRVSGESNAIERLMTAVTAFAPLGILILAGIAIPAYFFTPLSRPAAGLAESEER